MGGTHASSCAGIGTPGDSASRHLNRRKESLFAQRLGERLEASIGPEYGDLSNVLSAMRVVVRYHEESSEVWQAMFEHLVEASCRPLLADVTTAAPL
jgi:hypothetical protein